jgi:hypothetical protein
MDARLEHAGDDKPLDKKRWRTPVLIVAEVDETAVITGKVFDPIEDPNGRNLGPSS